MKLLIQTLKIGEYISPSSDVQWYTDEKSYVFIEALSPVTVERRKYKERVNIGQMVIGKRFRIVNPNPVAFATVRGVVFQLEEQHCEMMYPVVLNKHTEVTRGLLSLIYKATQTDLAQLVREITLEAESLFDISMYHDETSVQPFRNHTGQIDTRLIVINRYIRMNYMKPLTLTDLSDLIQCNPVYLSNTYAKVFKISPIKHLQKLKMNAAKNFLRESNLSVGEIAGKLGYVSSSQFADLFKRYSDMTPTEYRRGHTIRT